MNRPVQTQTDGTFVLYPGHIYRLMLVINGETTIDDLQQSLIAAGFDPTLLMSSSPDEWRAHRPTDWPVEPSPQVCVNECLVRVTGRYIAPTPMQFARDMPIAGGPATYAIVAAWDYVRAVGERQMVRVGAQAPTNEQKSGMLPLAAGMVMIGIGAWATWRSQKRVERDTIKIRELMDFSEHEERKALSARAGELAARTELDAVRALDEARRALEFERELRRAPVLYVEE